MKNWLLLSLAAVSFTCIVSADPVETKIKEKHSKLHQTAGSFSIRASFCVNKNILIKQIIEQLSAELELFTKAARASHAEATHEQNKAENKYDTRGLEASYLARGQSRQLAETEQAIAQFQSLDLLEFGPQTPIQLSALVELEGKGERLIYFIGPRAGGTEIMLEEKEILVITPQSPLGQQLMGKKQGVRLKMEIGGVKSEYRVVSVM